MKMTDWKELIEEATHGRGDLSDAYAAAQVSQAISLKRIADALEKQHTSWEAIEPGELHVPEPDPNLKRIADYLEGQGRLAARCQELQEIASREIERRREAEAEAAMARAPVRPLGAIDVDLEQHTSVGEMAAQAAKHGGAMILDVDTRPDGTQHAHAVASWDDADEGGRAGD
jgi:hypothetical protein